MSEGHRCSQHGARLERRMCVYSLEALDASQNVRPAAAASPPAPPSARATQRFRSARHHRRCASCPAYAPAKMPGMPGPYPGRVVAVKSDKSVDTATDTANDDVVREMMARGMRKLTGAGTTADAWRRFFAPSDIVGIKVNCGGYPHCVSAYEIVAEVVRQLTGIGVPVSQIYRLRAVSESDGRGQLRPASAGRRAVCRRRARQSLHATTTATIRPPTSRPISSAKRTRART